MTNNCIVLLIRSCEVYSWISISYDIKPLCYDGGNCLENRAVLHKNAFKLHAYSPDNACYLQVYFINV